MTTKHIDAEAVTPGDVYTDASGHVWQVKAVFLEPAIMMVPLVPMGENVQLPVPPLIVGQESGAVWKDFTCIRSKVAEDQDKAGFLKRRMQ